MLGEGVFQKVPGRVGFSGFEDMNSYFMYNSSNKTDAYGVVAKYCVKIKKKLVVEEQQEAME